MRFNVLDQWIDLFDRSIKALQHGQYQDVQKELQVQRFRQMLLLFLEQIEEIPLYGSYKDIILEHFLKINDFKNKNQLDISPNFNVTQANPFAYHNGISDTNVYRAYLDVPSYTLADIHSVIHQAWMSYNARAFVKQVGFSIDFIPLPMKLLLEHFKELPGLGHYFRFPSLLEFNAPMTRIKYNIPMNNHAVQVFLAYNFHQNIFHLKVEGYGGMASGMWNQSSIGVFRDASETNAIINRFDFYNYGFIFDADVTNPDDCLTLMRAFNNYLPYFHEEFEKIPCVIAEMSDAVCELFQKSKSFDHQVKNFYLNRTDKEKYQILLSSPSYNGMVLIKHGLLNAERLNHLSSEQLETICSDDTIRNCETLEGIEDLIATYSSSQLKVPPA